MAKEQVLLDCMVCGTEFTGDKPQMCCSGMECGCMGMPTEPIICSESCFDKLLSGEYRKQLSENKNTTQIIIND
jgi:hypothetical protein